jgi:PAS domain S-box-containing protein
VTRAASESELLYQSAIRAMSEGFVLHGPDGSIRTANPSAEHILGLTLDQMTGRSAIDPRWQLVRPDGSPLPPAEIPSEITRLTGAPCRHRLLGLHRPSGEFVWLNVSTDPVGRAGEPGLPVVATFTDVTAQRNANAEIEQSRAHFRRVIDAVPGVVYQYWRSPSGAERVPFMSARIQEIFGIAAEASVADPQVLWASVHPTDRPAVLDSLLESERHLTPWLIEFRVTRGDGSYRWLRQHALPERTETGVLWTGVASDVTEQRELEIALRHAQRRQNMADLAAGIAHNFNNMLGVVVPGIELALNSQGETQRNFLRDAQAAANNAAALVRELLSLSRPVREEDADATADVSEVAREVVRICRMTFDRSIRVEERIADSPAHVRGKANQLHQMLLNLCINARDALASREAPVLRVEVESEQPGPAQQAVILRVHDNGSGMDEATLARIGEPFFTTKQPGRGTGLGLASVFGTVRDLGGTIEYTSKLGGGTTFTVRFPALHRRPSDGPVVAKHTQSARASQRVLLVDDEPLVRKVVRGMLEHTGRSVVEASNGKEALERIEREGPFDAMLLDLSLPGLSGAKVLEELRARHPEVPVLILSGYVGETMLEGATAVLEKPVSIAQLTEALERL